MRFKTINSLLLVCFSILLISACASSGGVSTGHKVTKAGVILEYTSCQKAGQDVQCNLFLTADGRDMTVGISSGKSIAFDDVGNQYLPKKIDLANQNVTGNVYTPKFTKVVADVKTPLTIVFENVSTKAKEIKQLEIDFSTRKPERTDHNVVKFSGNPI